MAPASSGPFDWLYPVLLLSALAIVAFVLYRRWQSRRALVARLADLSLLADVGHAILGAQLDLTRLAELVYQQAGQIVDTSIFQLGLFEGDRYRLLIWVMDGETHPPLEFRLTPDSLGIVGWMRDSRRSLLVRDFAVELDALPAKPRYISENPPRSAVFVPLQTGDTVLGALAIQSRRPHAFSEEDLRLLTIVANQAAAALEKGRLYEQAQRRAAQLARLTEISQQLNVMQPLPDLYWQAVALAADRLGPYAVSYYETVGDRLLLRATTRPEWAGQTREVKFGDEHVGEAAEACCPVVVQELPEYLAESPAPPKPELAVPVEIDKRVLGVLEAQSRDGSPFDDIAISIFRSLAAQLAVGILEGQTYAAEQRRADQLATLAQVSRAVSSLLELNDLLDEVLELLDERFGYRRAHVFLLSGAQLVFYAGTGRWAERITRGEYALALDGPGLIALAGRTRRPVRADDVTLHPDYLPVPELPDTRAELSAPLLMGEQLLGVFDVQSEELNAFTQEDGQILQTLADTLAVAVRNARLFEAERRRRRLAETQREVSAALASTLQLDDVLALILNGLARVVTYDIASVLLVNDTGEIILRAMRGAPDAEALIGLQLDLKIFAPDEPMPASLPLSDVDEQHEYHDLLSLPDPHACLGAVLALPNEHLGYLAVDRAGAGGFAPEEAELIIAFAAQAAVAIQNARLFTAQREQAWMSTALLQVAESTATATELTEVLDTVARLTPLLVGVDRCGVLLADGLEYALRAYEGGEQPLPAPDLRFSREAWPGLTEMTQTHQPMVLAPDDPLPADLRPLFTGVIILLPLLVKGQMQGALVVGQAPGETPFTTHRIRLIGGIANQTALAVESAMLYQSQQEEAWVSTALLQVAEAVAGQPLEAGLETVARLTPLLVGIQKIVIYQWEAARAVMRVSQCVGLERAIAAQLLGQAATLEDLGLQADDTAMVECHLSPAVEAALGTPHGLMWPLRAAGGLLGALVVEAAPLLGRRLTILNGIAHQLAMAMENARLAHEIALQQRTERELEVGRDIQASFLPEHCPQAPGWEIAAFWRAARQVGGDFYDFIPLRSHEGRERWGIVIADVADKGVPAALFMALSRTLIRSVAINRVSPSATLARVNELILADSRTDQFVTVFYGVWEPATGHFVYANAGHNPPLLANAEGEVNKIPGRGTALGVLEEVTYQEHELHLHPGEMLFLYTDGVTDAVNAAMEEFTLGRAIEVLRAAHPAPASAIVRVMSAAIEEHVGGVEAFDDITMLVMRHYE